MKYTNRKTIIFFVVLSIASLLLSIIGATFAFFTASVRYIENPKEVVTKSEVLEIVYKRENNIYYKDILPGRPGYESQAINELKNSLKFSVQSNSSMSIKVPYNVYFVITENTFTASKNDDVYSNLVYTLNGTPGVSPIEKYDSKGNKKNVDSTIINTCLIKDEEQTIKCGTGQFFDDNNYVLHTFDDDLIPTKLGQIEALKTGRIKIGTAVLGAYGAKDEWEFELWVNEIGSEQNEDQGRLIRGYIEIDTEDDSLYKEESTDSKTS